MMNNKEERISRLHKLTTSVKVPSFISLRIVVLMALMVVMLSCSGKSENTSPFKVIDSGMWTLDDPWPTWWPDKDRVIFRSNDNFQYGVGPFKIHVWNTATGQLASTNVDRVRCAREGQVLYEEKDETTGKTTYYRGPIENARKYPNPDGSNSRLAADHSIWIDTNFDCAWAPKNMLSPYPPGDRKGPYKYKLRSSFFILERNSSFKEVTYPRALLQGRVTIHPVKPGYLVEYNSGRYTETDPGDRGLYLIRGEKVDRLIVGSVHEVSISPDGCKAAFIHARNTKEYFSRTKPCRTIKLINFCTGGNEQ
ncbi:hypothetical protein [Syntrophorhabdus aromaticivorans]|uniref:hypothetical protein n=1 Tax=Syntrophorhabdus aromaticivorans TaxID=328301 RepID=UPI0003FCA676|nr:hypothetical protein [Syntrophorhabdus aromaticivorans]